MAYENLNYSTDAGIAVSELEGYHVRELMKNVQPALTWARDMQMRPLPLGNGRKVQFRRMIPFRPSLRPLEEGVTKKGQKLRMTDMWITAKPYGEHIEFTDELDLYNIDNMHREMNRLLSRQAAESLNLLARNAKCSGTNVLYAGGRASRSALTAADKLDYDTLRLAVRNLENNLAPKFSDGYYHANIDPDTKFDLMKDPMWVDPAKYQDKSMIAKNEIGIIAGIKFFETTIGKAYDDTDPYLYYGSSTADTGYTELTVAAYDADKLTVTVAEALNHYAVRELGTKLVMIGNEPAFIEYATAGSAGTATLKLRWALQTEPTANTTKITPEASGPSGVAIRATVIYGQDFAGGISLGGNGDNVRIIVKPVGSSGSDDPYEQRGTIAYKIRGVGYHILQDAFGVRIEHAVSA